MPDHLHGIQHFENFICSLKTLLFKQMAYPVHWWLYLDCLFRW